MKFLLSSDWHADAKTHGVDRYPDVAAAVDQTVIVAEASDVDVYVMLGDLADPDESPAALRACELSIRTARRLRDIGVASWWVMGNHDPIEDGRGRSTLSPLRALGGNVLVFEHPEFIVGFGLGIVFLPHRTTAVSHKEDADALDRARAFQRNGKNGPKIGRVLVFGHRTIAGIHPGSETTDMPRGRECMFPFDQCEPDWLLFNGHYHEGQTFTHASGKHVLIPGSLARLTHGEEANSPRFLVFEV